MQINKEQYLKKFKVVKEFEFQEVGVAMSKDFKQNIWFLFHRFPLKKIQDGYAICQKKEIYTIAYILAVMNNLK